MNFKLTLIFSTALLPVVSVRASSGDRTSPKRPNILFIMSDDHSYQTISAYDTTYTRTPNIDRIAEDGVVFRNSFVCNSISGPARAVILTGKFSHLNGYYDNAPHSRFDGSQQTFPKLLQAGGYQTAVIGKWHLGSTPTGFDYYSVHKNQGTYYNPDFIEPDGIKQYHGYETDIVADNAIKWLEGRDKDKPFCLLMHFKAPHRNWMPAPEKMKLNEDVVYPVPSTFYDNYKGRKAAAAQEMSIDNDMLLCQDSKILGVDDRPRILADELYRMDGEQRKAWDEVYVPIMREFYENPPVENELAEWKYQRYMRDYLKCISSVDDNVGRLIDFLKANGLWENTIVIYTSDQGFYMGEHGWFDKRFMYEESFRTPFIMSYPAGIKKDVKYIDGLVQQIDYFPTFMDYAGLLVPDDVQGVSLRPLLEGSKDSVHDALYYHYYEYPIHHNVMRHYGVRDSRYKLIHFYYDVDSWELYDLEKDPHELNNVIDDPAYAKVKKRMMKKLVELQKKYKDETPTEGYFDPRTKK